MMKLRMCGYKGEEGEEKFSNSKADKYKLYISGNLPSMCRDGGRGGGEHSDENSEVNICR